MYFILSDFVFGFVFGVGASMVLMFACDRYDDYREKKEEEEKKEIMMKRIEVAKKRELEAKKNGEDLSFDEQMRLIREFSDPEKDGEGNA